MIKSNINTIYIIAIILGILVSYIINNICRCKNNIEGLLYDQIDDDIKTNPTQDELKLSLSNYDALIRDEGDVKTLLGPAKLYCLIFTIFILFYINRYNSQIYMFWSVE